MANFSFSIRASLGLIPSTEKIESAHNALVEEYQKLLQFAESPELKSYYELKELIESEAFKTNKKNINELDYKKTEAFQKEQKFLQLKKDKRIVNYFKVLQSKDYQRFLSINESDELAKYLDLQSRFEGNEHKEYVSQLNQQLKAELDKQKQYKQQKKSKALTSYYKIQNSKELKIYNELHDSEFLATYKELEAFVSSDELKNLKAELQEQLKNEMAKKQLLKQLHSNPEVKAYQNLKNKEEAVKPTPLVEYEALKEYLNSDDYKTKLRQLQYANTEEFKKEQQFEKLKKDAKIKSYLKFANSPQLNQYLSFKESDELKNFEELGAYLQSAEYQETLKSLTYNNTDTFAKEQEYKQLKNSEPIKFHQKFNSSKPYQAFVETEGSELLNEYQTLEQEINSEEFINHKNYLLDKDKWKKTDDYQKEQEFEALQKSESISWYFKVKDSHKFDALKAWKLTFEDDFTQGSVDETKWMNSFFWGKMLLNDRYVMAGDKQYYTDNQNVELNGTTLKLVTRNEKARGKVWHPVHGFSEKDFEYTSGMLSSAHSFRQLYGKFEAKIKLSDAFPVYQAFWLKGEKILPEIDVLKFNMSKRNKMQLATHYGDAQNPKTANKISTSVSGSSFTKGFFIYTMEWTAEKITWKINNTEVFSTSQGVPNEPLYLLFSSGIANKTNPENLPASMEIDWIRCYEKAHK
jgi:beta-glucanase (GH16 family)